MRRALDELVIEGVQTTIPLHRRIFRNPDFIDGPGRYDLGRAGPDATETEPCDASEPAPVGAAWPCNHPLRALVVSGDRPWYARIS